MAGSFGYELDLNTLSDSEKQAVKEQTARFKQYRGLIHNGLYYRLSDSLNDKFALWEYVSEDKKEVLVHGVIFRTEPNRKQYLVKLRGLLPDGNYRLEANGEVYKGSALMNGGILLPKSWGDNFPVEMHFISEN